jgi:hypothetical protein
MSILNNKPFDGIHRPKAGKEFIARNYRSPYIPTPKGERVKDTGAKPVQN